MVGAPHYGYFCSILDDERMVEKKTRQVLDLPADWNFKIELRKYLRNVISTVMEKAVIFLNLS